MKINQQKTTAKPQKSRPTFQVTLAGGVGNPDTEVPAKKADLVFLPVVVVCCFLLKRWDREELKKKTHFFLNDIWKGSYIFEVSRNFMGDVFCDVFFFNGKEMEGSETSFGYYTEGICR